MKSQEYNMIKEIEEQPAVLRRLFKLYVRNNQLEMREFKEFEDKLLRVRRFSFWGIGSSYHACIYANYLFEELCKVPCEAESADELIVRKNVLECDTAVVAISQSGETTDLIEAVKRAKMEKVLTIGILNNSDSTLASLVDVALQVRAGEEKALATTKAFSAQMFMLVLLAIYYNQFKTRYNDKLLSQIAKLPEKIQQVIGNKAAIAALAKKYKKINRLTVLGRQWHYSIALETALKLKETTYLPAEGMATETFRHGPEAIIDKKFLSLLFLPKNKNYKENLIALEEIIKAGGKAIAVVNEETEKTLDQIVVPTTDSIIQPIVSVVVGQLFAYYLALERGLDVDHPRNIFKYITK
jgi:glucosamine--fructose-6-phosphate aminotransferase (isomerizing)